MKVQELIEYLEDCDENANVYIGSQPAWPFEYDITGIVTRGDVWKAHERELAAEEDSYGEDREDDRGEILKTDVFILEGTQLRYGDKYMWSEM